MRRTRDHRPSTLFRGSELPRLLTLMIMLGVLVMLIGLAGDPNTWRWLAPDAGGEPAERLAAGADNPGNVVAPDPAVGGPTDDDAAERDAAREEFQAVTDKTPLAGEEMPAYWRLMAWQQHQTTGSMLRRAQADVSFRQLWQQPQAWRGRLVRIAVHLRRTATVENLEDNALGLATAYEVWGWNTDSQPYWYWLVCPQLPPGMPTGNSIYEEATFVGYFFKLLPYEDHQGKTLATPLLIGRLVWHPTAANPLARSDEWTWPWYLAGVLMVLFVVRWGLALLGWTSKSRPGRTLPTGGSQQQVAAWLESAERADGEPDERSDSSDSREHRPSQPGAE